MRLIGIVACLCVAVLSSVAFSGEAIESVAAEQSQVTRHHHRTVTRTKTHHKHAHKTQAGNGSHGGAATVRNRGSNG